MIAKTSRQYKFQALVRIYTDGDGRQLAALGAAPRRVVLLGYDVGEGVVTRRLLV